MKSKEEIVAEQRARMSNSGKGGFRREKPKSRLDKLRIDACYDKETEKYVETSLEDMQKMSKDENFMKTLSGTPKQAFLDSLTFKIYEDIAKKQQVEKEQNKEEVPPTEVESNKI